MKINAIIEARMNSSRLPGKVLMHILGKPALSHLIERLKRTKYIKDIILATTINPKDDVLEKFANDNGIKCYRGSEEDVMGRVVQAATVINTDVIVEITGDCVLIAPEVIDKAIEIYKTGKYDIVSNTWNFSYPQGTDVQIFSHKLLADAYEKTKDPAHREHVSLYFYENPDLYKIYFLEAPPEFKAPHLRFQLDYKEDLEFIRKIYEELHPKNKEFSLKEIFQLLNDKPELAKINSHMKEKEIR